MRTYFLALGFGLLAMPAAAQLGVPGVGLPGLDLPGRILDQPLREAGRVAERAVARLERLRTDRLADFVRANRRFVEMDAQGAVARRGELLLVDSSPAQLAMAEQAGFPVIASESIKELGIEVTRVAVPPELALARAEQRLAQAVPEAEIVTDVLHFQSGAVAQKATTASPTAPRGRITVPVGMIDGGPAARQPVTRRAGFAKGAPAVGDHGSAVASLLAQAGVSDVRAADVYGTDPAGGNALALTRALAWLTAGGAKVVTISLVGPRNALVEKAVRAAQQKGVTIVAAVGNDGAAAPPAYPASYAGVLAVTGVDRRSQALIEAGRALHLDYAAPGADMLATNARSKWTKVRGTSFAAPLVAARAAAALEAGPTARAQLDREAADLGPKGPDGTYGRGLLCGTCPRRP